MRNILATSAAPRRFAGISLSALGLSASLLGSTLWGAWATHKIVTLERREVVTVQRGLAADRHGDTMQEDGIVGAEPLKHGQRCASVAHVVLRMHLEEADIGIGPEDIRIMLRLEAEAGTRRQGFGV